MAGLTVALLSVGTAPTAAAAQAGTGTGAATATRVGGHAPDVPTDLKIDSCYLACASPAVIQSGTPTLWATVSDPDGGTVRVQFQVYDAAGERVADSGTTVTGVSSGSARPWRVVPAAGTVLPDGGYRWRVRACDTTRCGGWAPWFAFTVDSAGLPVPTVSGDPYAEKSTGTWNGGPGQPGEFTFGANGGIGVIEYIYQLNNGPAVTVPVTGPTTVVTITPRVDGVNVLTVLSRKVTGMTSDQRVYQFLVRPPAPAHWRWSLDEGTGAVAASEPADHPVSFSPTGVGWTTPGRVGDAAVALTGTGDLSTVAPVLDTTAPAGFTVAAFVRLDAAAGARTAVSQDGANTSVFRLGYRDDRDVDGDGAADPAWCFTVALADLVDAPESVACVAADPADWVSLVGSYQPAAGKIRIYVNGGARLGGDMAEADHIAGWRAGGAFAIGRGSGGAERWTGELDEVQAEQRVWEEIEVLQYADQ